MNTYIRLTMYASDHIDKEFAKTEIKIKIKNLNSLSET